MNDLELAPPPDKAVQEGEEGTHPGVRAPRLLLSSSSLSTSIAPASSSLLIGGLTAPRRLVVEVVAPLTLVGAVLGESACCCGCGSRSSESEESSMVAVDARVEERRGRAILSEEERGHARGVVGRGERRGRGRRKSLWSLLCCRRSRSTPLGEQRERGGERSAGSASRGPGPSSFLTFPH